MTILSTLVDLVQSITDLTLQVTVNNAINGDAGGGCGCPSGTELEPPPAVNPPPVGTIDAPRCKRANFLVDWWIYIMSDWASRDFDALLTFGIVAIAEALTAGVALGAIALASIPLTGGLVVIVGLVLALAGYIAGNTAIDFADIQNVLQANKNAFICTLYNGTNSASIKEDLLAQLTGFGLSSVELQVMEYVINNMDVNSVIDGNVAWELDSYTSTFDCASCLSPQTIPYMLFDKDSDWRGVVTYNAVVVANGDPIHETDNGNGIAYEITSVLDGSLHVVTVEFYQQAGQVLTPFRIVADSFAGYTPPAAADATLLVGNPQETLTFESFMGSFIEIQSPSARGTSRRLSVRSTTAFTGRIFFDGN